jgi:hypothetical protein
VASLNFDAKVASATAWLGAAPKIPAAAGCLNCSVSNNSHDLDSLRRRKYQGAENS